MRLFYRGKWITLQRKINRYINKMILQFGVLLAFLAAGELLVRFTGIPVPSSIIGMVLLCASLKLGIVKLK